MNRQCLFDIYKINDNVCHIIQNRRYHDCHKDRGNCESNACHREFKPRGGDHPCFVLFVRVLVLFSSFFLVSSSFSLSFSLCFCFCPYPLCSFKTINIKDKCKDTKTRISYRTDTLLMIIALIHTMYESELRFASFENKR